MGSCESSSRKVRRRRLRFTLRSLLVLTTAVCVWLALQVNMVNRHDRLIAKIKQRGEVSCGFEGAGDGTLVATAELWLPDRARQLLSDHVLRVMGLRRWTSLRITTRQLTDEDLAQIAQLEDLQGLTIAMPYELIDLRGTTFPSDEGVAHLSALTNLRELSIVGDAPLTDRSLRLLATLPYLESLYLDGDFTDHGVEALHGKASLQHLSLSSSLKITERGLAHLSSLPNLSSLSLQRTSPTSDGLKHLMKLPRLRSLAYDETELEVAP